MKSLEVTSDFHSLLNDNLTIRQQKYYKSPLKLQKNCKYTVS